MTLTTSQGLHSLSQLGVDHRDVSIGNVLLGTDPDKAAGFISDLDLSSISMEVIKAAYPNDCDTIIEQMKGGEWRTVCNHLEGTQTPSSYTLYAQGTALFMACDLLNALDTMNTDGLTASDFPFQHRLGHDLESLIWVVVYAIMIHHRNNLAPADTEKLERYKGVLDHCWASHAYSNILTSHDHMMVTGCSPYRHPAVSLWFPDPHEAAFFCGAMRLILLSHMDGGRITYESLCALFRQHINLAKELQAFDIVSK